MDTTEIINRFRERVRDFIALHRLLPAPKESTEPTAPQEATATAPTPQVIVTLSGGADSVALLDVLTALGYDCLAAHCNFHLRGAESDRDERHAREVAARCGTPIEVRHFDIAAYRRTHPRRSVEMACREVRYAWFDELSRRLDGAPVAVAHHRDDSVETLLLNALRSSGLTGLGGIRPRRDGIIRPLLTVSRADIELYLQARGISYVTDSSNLSLDYRRNRLRQVVLPALRSQFDDADAALAATAAHVAEAAALLQAVVQQARQAITDPADGSLDLSRLLAAYPGHAGLVLFEMLKDQGLDRSTTDAMLRGVASPGRVYAGRYRMQRGGRLTPISSEPLPEALSFADPRQCPALRVQVLPRSEFDPKADPTALYLSLLALEPGHTWELRPWREGDRIEPFGLRGSRKLSDIFSDMHMPVDLKRRQLVLTLDGRIIWVVGKRASRHYAVTPSDDQFIKIISY